MNKQRQKQVRGIQNKRKSVFMNKQFKVEEILGWILWVRCLS